MHPRSSFGQLVVRVPTMTRADCQSRIFWLLRLILLSESCYQSKGFQGNPAGLGLVDTLPRDRSAPQGEVKDTWIFPPQLYHLQCFSQVLHCQNSLYAFKCYCLKRKFQTLGDSKYQGQVRWCQTMPPSNARWPNAISYDRRPVAELNGIPGYCQVCWHSFSG